MSDQISLSLRKRLFLVLISSSFSASAQDFDKLGLLQVASGLSQPIAVVTANDQSNRLFIIEQHGVIRILNINSGMVNITPFLDISALIDNAGNEQGLLGLAFHPDYIDNGFFFVHYTRGPSGNENDFSVVARYQVSAEDPDIADTTETKILEVSQDWNNHNGGDLQFGPDGYLYIALGDGGRSNDIFDNAQNLDTLKGAILRIDVDGSPDQDDVFCGLIQNYGIPADNPFKNTDGCDEIWSYGLRNPWRFSFDRQTGDMYIGDVGQGTWEEIDFEPANTAGVNYGWSCREGAHDFAPGNACISSDTDPILEYDHNSGCSVTGGFVYRGDVSAFNGYYFYGDYCSDRVWLARNPGPDWVSTQWVAAADILASISSFGQDEEGNLYIADRDGGKLFRINIEQSVIFSDSFENP